MIKFFSVLCLLLVCSFTSLNAQDFSTHQVKKGETIEDISKRYYITPQEIYSLNPDAKKELKPNTVLIIPLSKSQKPKITTVKELEGFKTHKTKRKETLFSLSKKYEVEIDEIKKYNTFLYANPLRKGDKLQIPTYKITEVVEEQNETQKYKVLPKEGKWRIAYKFGITVEDLEALNPEMGDVLKDGEEINVPNIGGEALKQVDEQYSYYKVLPAEGFYRLKIKLGLNQDELEALNPDLKESGLKKGMILKVPFSEKLSTENTESSIAINLVDSISDFSTKRIAIMLPFRLSRGDLSSLEERKRSIKSDKYLNASLDFHSGVLLAIDSLKTLGVSLKMDVYDTNNQVSEVSKIIEENDFESVDAVIGPLMPKNFEKAASDLRKFNVPIVSPTAKDLKLYDNVFQSKPSNDLLKDKVVNYIKADSLVNNVVIISDTENIDIAKALKLEFSNAKLIQSRKDKKSGKDDFYVTKQDIAATIKPGKNVVFLETKRQGFASNVTSVLASLIKTKENSTKKIIDIVLVTTNYRASAFEGDDVSNEHLSKLQFHYATSSKSYNDDNSFAKKYKHIYKITPNVRAVKGFDLTMDVVLRLVSSGDLYKSVNNAPLTEYVENKFAYKKKSFGGYYNDTIYLVKHSNLNIVDVD